MKNLIKYHQLFIFIAIIYFLNKYQVVKFP